MTSFFIYLPRCLFWISNDDYSLACRFF